MIPKFGAMIPKTLERAVRNINARYSSGGADISCTALIGPPQISALRHAHGPVERPVQDSLFAVMGTAMHWVLEQGAGDEAMVEERMFAERRGWKISGQADLIENGWITDWKFASVWEVIHGAKPDRERQLNVLAWLARENGMEVEGVAICYLFRDWSATKARTQRGYPNAQIYVAQMPLWSPGGAEAYVLERVELHQRARAGEQIDCTDEERWKDADKWAVMKKGRKSALKLHQSPCEASGHIKTLEQGDNKGLYIEHRVGEARRCQQYCDYADHCPQWQAEKYAS
jgi:hypothetical protein